jgi:hypothetical protein
MGRAADRPTRPLARAQGVLRMGQEIEIRPGITTKDASGAMRCIPIYSRIVSLFAEQNPLQFAVPGGLIGVGTTVDPTLTRADRLVGQVCPAPPCLARRLGACQGGGSGPPWMAADVLRHPPSCRPQVLGEVGALPDVFTELEINFFLLRRLLGVRTQVTTAAQRRPSCRRRALSAALLPARALPSSRRPARPHYATHHPACPTTHAGRRARRSRARSASCPRTRC